jgi:superoxide dismutase, Fe-Mn family
MKHALPELSYGFDTLEPVIDAKTVEIHYTKHHQNYVNNLNTALEKHPELFDLTVDKLLSDLESVPEDIRTAVKNNAGGHYNHSFYWTSMKPLGKTPTPEKLTGELEKYEAVKEEFINSATKLFGSGWTWLVINPSTGKIEVTTTPNQDSPISQKKTPILTLDLWEHAYYLKYQNRRAEYIANWWTVVNWEEVEKRLLSGLAK